MAADIRASNTASPRLSIGSTRANASASTRISATRTGRSKRKSPSIGQAKSSGCFTSARRRPVITPTSGAFPVPAAGRERPSWNSSSPTRVSHGKRTSSTRTEIRRRVPRISSASPANSTSEASKSNGGFWTRLTSRRSTAKESPAFGWPMTRWETGSRPWPSLRTGSRPFIRKVSRSGSANMIGTATSSRRRTWAPTTSRSSSRPVTPNGVANTTSRGTASPKAI